MKKSIIFIVLIVSLSSCGSYKRLAYLQDMNTETTYEVTQVPETRIVRGDELTINVMSSQPLLAAPFNIRPETTVIDSSSAATAVGSGGSSYKVDTKGRINFPVLGPVVVEGLTLNELSTLLVDEIRSTNYLKDPIVTVAFKNFEVIVLGETKKTGIYNFPNGNVNIFQLLATVEDLTEDAQRDNVWVIRTTNGTRKVYSLNLKSKSVYDSPAFYLQQNDMVYAAPLDNKMDQKTQNVFQWITTPLSLLSTIFSGWALVRTYTR